MESDRKKQSTLGYLRIIIIATCLLLWLIINILWVRSRYSEDRISGHVSSSEGFRIYSSHSCLIIYAHETPDAVRKYPWRFDFGVVAWLQERDNRISAVPKVMLQPQVLCLTLPYWFIAISTAAIAIVTPRIGRRFSLRTLLIITTLVAVVLGVIAALR